LILALSMTAICTFGADETGRSFATPEEAVAALQAAAESGDHDALQSIFGPSAEELQNPDRVQAAEELSRFTAAITKAKKIVRESDTCCVLEIGEDFWPFPVPVVQKDGKWFFDTVTGIDELLSRRIGRNELMTLTAMRTYVEAQREYAAKDRDGDEVLEFAQKFISSPGMMDGLYWSPELNGEISPLGPLAAQAQSDGYKMKSGKESGQPTPFHGYFFKVITRQERSAPGGRYDYIINGNMIGGFALLAWPAGYGESGIMTFIVNQQGRVYEKDLGKDTAKAAARIKSYDPDKGWTLSTD